MPRLLSLWQIGRGDYVRAREALFAGEAVDSLFEQAAACQTDDRSACAGNRTLAISAPLEGTPGAEA